MCDQISFRGPFYVLRCYNFHPNPKINRFCSEMLETNKNLRIRMEWHHFLFCGKWYHSVTFLWQLVSLCDTFYSLQVELLRNNLSRTRVKVSQALENMVQHVEIYMEYDPLITPTQPSNPWVSEDLTYWQLNSPL